MKVDIFNQQNNKVDTIELPDRIFAVKWNPDLVHQALMAQLANRRQPLAHAKNRSEVKYLAVVKNLGNKKAPAGQGTVQIVRLSGLAEALLMVRPKKKISLKKSIKR